MLKTFFSLVLLFTLNACAQPLTFNGFLWKISKTNNSSSTNFVYVLGITHEVKGSEKIEFSSKINELLDGPITLITEADISPASAEREKIISMSRGNDLNQFLEPAIIEKLNDYLTKVAATSDQRKLVTGLHPMALHLWLTTYAPALNIAKSQNAPQILKIDSKLINIALERKNNIDYLEGANDFMAVWSESCPGKTEYSIFINNDLNLLLNRKEPLDTTFLRLVPDGKKNDFEAAYKNLLEENTGEKVFLNCNIEPRNAKWMTKISGHVENNNKVLIAVGAAHLYGDKGLISLLRSKGYQAEFILQK